MKKGSYVVQEVYEGSGGGVKGGGGGGASAPSSAPHAHPDSSYSSCLLALLFFLALCIIIMLAAWPWNRGKSPPPLDENDLEDYPIHEGFSGDKDSTTPHHGVGPGKDPTTKAPTTKGSSPRPSPTEEPNVPSEATSKPRVPPTHQSPQEEEEGHGEDDGGHHHPHPWKGQHPHPGKGHHPHPHEVPETTTPTWDPPKDTTPHAGHTKGGVVKDGPGRPVKGLRPRIGDGEEDPSAEWLDKTRSPGEQTEAPGDEKRERIVDARREEGGSDPRAVVPSANPVGTTTAAEAEGTTPMTTPPPHAGEHAEAVARDKTPKEHAAATPADEGSGVGGPSEGEGTKKGETTTAVHAAYEADATTESTHPPLNTNNYSEEDKTKEVEEEEKPEVCQTPSCKSLASRILAFMDHSVEPCDDFYQYACGGMTGSGSSWIYEETPGGNAWSRITDMLNRVNQFSPISQQKFKSFFDSCIYYDHLVNLEERLKKAHDVLASVGRFYRDTEWRESPGNLTILIGNLLKYHFSPLFDIHLDVDAKSSKFSIKLTAPVNKSPLGDPDGVALNGWVSETCKQIAIERPEDKINVDFNERHMKYIECSCKYEQYIQEVKHAIEALNIIKHENETIAQKLITDTTLYLDVLLAETGMKMLPSPGEKRRILLAKEFHMYSLREMTEKFPLVEWRFLISMLLNQDIAEDTEIQVYFEDYFQSFIQNLTDARLEERQVNNALMAMFAHELYYGLVINRSPCNRKAYCLNVAKELMDPIASALFLKSFDTAQLSAYQSKISSIYKELLTTLKLEISNLEWMDKNSQILALDKLQNLKLYADGGMSVFLNESFLEAQFAKEAVNKSYLENTIDLMKRYRERMYETYQKNPFEPEQIWSHFLLPFRERGIVIYGLNSIVIPFGQMFKPFFSDDYPLYVQMSGLGFMIAHEIWHEFDTTGIKYDSKGHKNNKFSEETFAAINKTAKCFTEQANVLVLDVTSKGEKFSFRLDPSISLNERLVDVGGAHLAFKTIWKSATLGASGETLPWTSLTPQQLYFLSLAQNFCTKSSAFDYTVSIFEDEHLPPFRRVNDIVFNSIEFAEAFSCSTMEKHRCQPFTLANNIAHLPT